MTAWNLKPQNGFQLGVADAVRRLVCQRADQLTLYSLDSAALHNLAVPDARFVPSTWVW
jgi:hypothetical protein